MALVCIGLRCVTSLHSLDKSPSPLRLFPPYPLPLTRCIQAKFSRVRSIEMTTSAPGVQQLGNFPIGATAERLGLRVPWVGLTTLAILTPCMYLPKS